MRDLFKPSAGARLASGGGGGPSDWRSDSGATSGDCVSATPFASTTVNTRLAEAPASSVPDPADVLDAVIWNENVHVPFGMTPNPLPQDTNVVPASRDAVFWVTKVRIEMPERADPVFWRVIEYGTLGPSRIMSVGAVELRLELTVTTGVTAESMWTWREGPVPTTTPFTVRSNSTPVKPGTSVPVPALLLDAASAIETVHVPVGRMPEPLPHWTGPAPAARRAPVVGGRTRVPSWFRKLWIDTPERLGPGFWSVTVYGVAGPSRSMWSELTFTPTIVGVNTSVTGMFLVLDTTPNSLTSCNRKVAAPGTSVAGAMNVLENVHAFEPAPHGTTTVPTARWLVPWMMDPWTDKPPKNAFGSVTVAV
jgi:hypothetical protein